MKIQSLSLCIGLSLLALATAAQAQTYSKRAQLDLAATGDAFAIGDKTFRLAPSAEVRKAEHAPGRDEVVVADYVIEPAPAAKTQPLGRSAGPLTGASSASAAANGQLAAAVADDGTAIVLLPQLDVYVDHISVVDTIVRDTGGTLTFSTAAGGKATIRYGSVAEAMQARQRILGRAGVKEVNPSLLPPLNHPQ